MWYMPSYGRPQALRSMLDAPGAWPQKVIVLVNEDDPQREAYKEVARDLIAEGRRSPWVIWTVPAGSRCSDAHRFITQLWPDDPFYGLLCDDHWPITPGWHFDLAQAAGDRYIATPAGEPSFPKLRNAVVLGGELVRAMGSLVPVPVKHNFEDNLWDQVAEDFDLLRPRPNVIVEHRHWIHGKAEKDKTYQRGSADFATDQAIFTAWMGSLKRIEMSQRIGQLLGYGVSALDPSTIRLAIVVPIGDEIVDIGYHRALCKTMIELRNLGINMNIIESTGGSNVGKSRERVLWMAMANKPTHLMWIDSDMAWEPSQVVRLLASDHEFSCVVGVRKTDELKLCCNFFASQEFHPRTKFLKLRDVGFAFVMLKVSVIEKLCAAYPDLEYNAGEMAEYALFLEMIDERRERLSEDFAFCNRWRAIGGEIWGDPDAAIVHVGRKEYTGKLSDVFERAPKQIAAE